MPNKTILFTRPNSDLATACLNYFSKNLVDELRKIGIFTIINIEGRNANKEEFEKAIRKANPRLLIINGHGDETAIYGQKEQILGKNNIKLLNHRIIYAVACESSEKLGDLAIDEGGAEAYIGYEAKFMIVVDPSRSSTPDKDRNIKVFIKPYMALVLSLISGFSVGEAIDNTKKIH